LSSLYVLGINPLSGVQLAKIFLTFCRLFLLSCRSFLISCCPICPFLIAGLLEFYS
jgi:hypothetical protein